MLFWAFLLAALTPAVNSQGFDCLQHCRVPFFTCINSGIPGHEIKLLQQCVLDDVQAGTYDQSHPTCVTCVKDRWQVSTDFPTNAPTIPTPHPTQAPIEVDFCKPHTRKRVCLDKGAGKCKWDTVTNECIPGVEITKEPTFPGIVDIRPCLSDCRDFALECAFNRGVPQQCDDCMRACTVDVSEEKLKDDPSDAMAGLCSSCMRDLFFVIGDPNEPPKAGFVLFTDYKRWMSVKSSSTNCKASGGKWKIKGQRGLCVINKAKKLRCKKITKEETCTAVGCNAKGGKKFKCAGAHKWK